MKIKTSKLVEDAMQNTPYSFADVVSIIPVQGSHSSTVRILKMKDGGKIVLKVPFTFVKWQREKKILETLDSLQLTPRLLSSTLEDNSVNALFLEFISGKTVQYRNYSPELCKRAGLLLAKLHMMLSKSTVSSTLVIDEFEEHLSINLDNARPLLRSKSWHNRIKNHFNITCYPSIGNKEVGVAHLDYRPGNLIIDAEFNITAIDFESTRRFFLAIDFVEFYKNLPASKFNYFINGYSQIRTLPFESLDLIDSLAAYRSLACIAWAAKHGREQSKFCIDNLKKLDEIVKYM